MRNITKFYVAKNFGIFFIMPLKGLINVTKSIIYTIRIKFKVVTFKLNIIKYISLKVYYVVVKINIFRIFARKVKLVIWIPKLSKFVKNHISDNIISK